MVEKEVSIIMSVYNGEKFLAEALEGILVQTYRNWECIVINDCSTDRTGEILEQFEKRDSRIRVCTNEKNMKLPASLNRALEIAQGDYILRMDADDICRKDRIEKQVRYMEEHPELALSCCRYFALQGKQAVPTCLHRRGDWEDVKGLFLFFNPVLHPGVIFRRIALASHSYNPRFSCTEDFRLWTEMLLDEKKIGIQEDYLMLYRIHENQVTITKQELQRTQYQEIISEFYEKRVFPLSQEELAFLTDGVYLRTYVDVNRFLDFARKVMAGVKKSGFVSQEAVYYGCFEILMAYRGEAGLSGRDLVRAFSIFPLSFLVREFIRRKRASRESLKKIREAAEIFGLRRAKEQMQSGVPLWEMPTD